MLVYYVCKTNFSHTYHTLATIIVNKHLYTFVNILHLFTKHFSTKWSISGYVQEMFTVAREKKCLYRRRSLAKQGDNALDKVRPSVRLI